MTAEKLSRREWFRLKPGHQNQMLSSAGGKEANTLTPIERPPNYDGMDLSKLPPMREALLSRAQVESLFNDIAALATEVSLMQKQPDSGGNQRATGKRAHTTEQLRAAQRMLSSGNIQRLQIRYRWENSLWIDTLETRGNQYRLVRIEHAG